MKPSRISTTALCAIVWFTFASLFCQTIAQPPINFTEADAGTASNPYQIATLANLRWLSETNSVWGNFSNPPSSQRFFLQTADIDASETISWNYGRGFAPIGSEYTIDHFWPKDNFTGSYNGQNFIISNLYVYSPAYTGNDPYYAPDTYWHIGMFGNTHNAVFQNMWLENASINGSGGSLYNAGLLCGEATLTTFRNCFVSGNVNISSANTRKGGIAATVMNSIVEYCSSIIYSEATGCLIGAVGKNPEYPNARSSIVSNSYGRGSTQLDGTGLFRFVQDNSTIYKVYVTSSSPEITNNNRLAYNLYSTSFTNSIWDTETTEVTEPFQNIYENCSIENICGLTTAEMKNADNYIAQGWDFENIWAIDPAINDGYPYLRHDTIPQYLGDNDITTTTITSQLLGNFPNPFNPSTTIRYSIAEVGNVKISVYNIKGQLVRSLVNDPKETGHHTVIWNGDDNVAKKVSSGIYFYKMETKSGSDVKKMLLHK